MKLLQWVILLFVSALMQPALADIVLDQGIVAVDGIATNAKKDGEIDPRLFDLHYENGTIASVPPECFVKLERNERASKMFIDKNENNLTPVPPLAIMPLDCYDVDEKPHTYFNHETGFYESKIRNEIFGYKVVARNRNQSMVLIKYQPENKKEPLYTFAIYKTEKMNTYRYDTKSSVFYVVYNKILLRQYYLDWWGGLDEDFACAFAKLKPFNMDLTENKKGK